MKTRKPILIETLLQATGDHPQGCKSYGWQAGMMRAICRKMAVHSWRSRSREYRWTEGCRNDIRILGYDPYEKIYRNRIYR